MARHGRSNIFRRQYFRRAGASGPIVNSRQLDAFATLTPAMTLQSKRFVQLAALTTITPGMAIPFAPDFSMYVGSAATPTNWNRVKSLELWNGGRLMSHVGNFIGGSSGTTWALITGSSAGIGAGAIASYWNPASDPVAARIIPTFGINILPYGGLAGKSPDGADFTVTAAANNGSGLIRLTTAAHGLSTGNRVSVFGVGGVPNAEGAWTVTVISTTVFDLQGSTFAGAFTSGGVMTTRSTMARGIAGDYDTFIDSIANSLATNGLGVSGKVCVLRIGAEFNLSVFPWNIRGTGTSWAQSGTSGDGTPANFVAYFRRIVTRMRAILPDALFSWNPSHNSPDSTSTFGGFTALQWTESAYPGDAYVDVIGYDLYDTRNNGYTVIGATNNGSGLIRLQFSASHNIVTGDSVHVANVGGVTNANGTWQSVINVDTTHIDLVGSTFAGVYTSGGVCSWGTTRAWSYHTNGNIGIQGIGLDWLRGVNRSVGIGKLIAFDEWGLWRPATVAGGPSFSGGDDAKWIALVAAYIESYLSYAVYFDGTSDNQIADYDDSGLIATDDADFPLGAVEYRADFAQPTTGVTNRSLAATTTITAAMTRVAMFPRALAAATTITPAFSRVAKYFRAEAATTTITPTLSRVVVFPRSLAATMVATVVMSRLVSFLRTFAVTMTATVTLARVAKFFRTFAAATTITPTMANVRSAARSFPVTVTLTPTMARQAVFSRLLAGSATFTATLVRLAVFLRTLAASSTVTPTMARKLTALRTFAASATLTAALSRIAFRAINLPVASTLVAAMVRVANFPRTLNSTTTLTPAMTAQRVGRTFPVSLDATTTLIVAMTRKMIASRLVAVTVTFAVTQARAVKDFKTFAATTVITPAFSVASKYARAMAASTVVTAALTRLVVYRRTLAATVTMTPALVWTMLKLFATNTVITATMLKGAFNTRPLAAVVTFTATMVKQPINGRTLAVTATFTAALTRQVKSLRTLAVTATFTAALTRLARYGRSFALTGVFTAALVKASLRKITFAAFTTVIPILKKVPGLRLNASTTLVPALSRTPLVSRLLAVSASFTAFMSSQRQTTRTVRFDLVVNMIVGMGRIAKVPSMPPAIMLRAGLNAVLRFVGLGKPELESVGFSNERDTQQMETVLPVQDQEG